MISKSVEKSNGAQHSEEVAQIAAWLRLFIRPGQVTELRAIGVANKYGSNEHIETGYFDADHLDVMAKEAMRLSPTCKGVYFVPNAVHPDLLARCWNRIQQAKKDGTTADDLVIWRYWICIDADPNRLADISSTDEEKSLAFDLIVQAREFVHSTGFSKRTILCDSGNGYHCMCGISLPPDATNRLRSFLYALQQQFNTDRVKIDEKMFNAARIVKLYGTVSRKGDSTPTRPHRVSKVLDERTT